MRKRRRRRRRRMQSGQVQCLAANRKAHWCSKLNAVLKSTYKVRVSKLDDMKVVSFLHVLHPLIGLPLRINHQWPATSITERERERM